MDQNKNAQGTQQSDKASQQNRVHQPSESRAEQESGNRGGNSDNQERGTGSQGEMRASMAKIANDEHRSLVLEEGYTIHDRLLRPARVGVAKRARPPLDS